jgi:hypothetical protein
VSKCSEKVVVVGAFRHTAIQSLLTLLEDSVNNLIKGIRGKPTDIKYLYNDAAMDPSLGNECNLLLLSTLLRSLAKVGLWPVPKASEVVDSYTSVLTRTQNINVKSSPHRHHHDYAKIIVTACLVGSRSRRFLFSQKTNWNILVDKLRKQV